MKPITIIAASALAMAPALALAQSGPFLGQQGPELWRASRLVGVDVLGPDGRKVGTVSDVLMDHDGHAADVVIAVGGFLGLGQKDVALPYASVRFTQEPRAGGPGRGVVGRAPDESGGMPTEPGMAAGSAVPVETPAAQSKPPAAAVGGPVGTTAGVPGGTAAPARSTARPDHAAIDLTAEQLKAAPAFSFAP